MAAFRSTRTTRNMMSVQRTLTATNVALEMYFVEENDER